MSKKINKIAQFEKAISQRYGEEVVASPKKDWTDKKEKEYQEQIKEVYLQERRIDSTTDKIEVDGFLVSKKLLNRDNNRSCPVCGIYSFEIRDNIYMIKFDCCFKCYIQWVEDREDRWKSGWRPEKEK